MASETVLGGLTHHQREIFAAVRDQSKPVCERVEGLSGAHEIEGHLVIRDGPAETTVNIEIVGESPISARGLIEAMRGTGGTGAEVGGRGEEVVTKDRARGISQTARGQGDEGAYKICIIGALVSIFEVFGATCVRRLGTEYLP